MNQIFKNISNSYLIVGLSVVCAIFLIVVLWPTSLKYNSAKAEIIPFDMEVSAEGEVQALECEQITVPDLLSKRELRVWYLKITDLVEEGTNVKVGDFIATLDPSDVESRLQKYKEKIEEYENSLESAILDSTIVLNEKREELANTKDNLEECEIKVEYSKFESRATRRQSKITLEKAILDINTKRRNYEKATQKQKVIIARIQKKLKEQTHIRDLLLQLKKQLRITSPSSGIVVYGKSWRGKKIKVNDDVGPWMPVIATIPDLNSLISEAIVKEIDIAKIKIGQEVSVVVDAFPEDVFKGVVRSIANIGQPIKGAGMNGFKVTVVLDKKGKKILPSMTTSNKILIASYTTDIVVPREAVFGDESSSFVFFKKGSEITKKTVVAGGENETHIRIISGLHEGDEVLLSRPKEFEEL